MKSKSKKEEREKFKKWWSEIEPALIKSATRMVHDEGRDVVQNVGILALKNLDRFAQYDDFARWCHIRTRFLALDELARIKRVVVKEPLELENLISQKEEMPYLDLMPLIDKLPDRQRLVVLHMLAGYRTDEIAKRMNINLNTVRSNWRHAQNNLAKENI